MTLRTYWAAEPTDKIGTMVVERVRRFRMWVQTTGRLAMWQRSTAAYYGLDPGGSYRNSAAVTFRGAEGERVELRINLLRMLVRATVVLATGSRPTYTCRPRAYDAQTTELVGIGNAIMDMYLDRDVERHMTEGEEMAIVLGDGAVAVTWDTQSGKVVGQDEATGKVVREGDIRVQAFRADEVIRDCAVTNGEHDWVILCRRVNRWSLASEYPDYYDTIVNAPARESDSLLSPLRWDMQAPQQGEDSDQITVYEFYHRATSALPLGRSALIVGGEAIADGPNPYGEELPIAWIIPSKDTGTAFGYGEIWDCIAPQQALDSCVSQAVTHQENYGQTSLMATPGNEIDVELVKGVRIFTSPGGAPAPVDTTGNGASNAIAMAEFLQSMMMLLRSMNETSVGAGGTSPSGASIAMQMQQTVQNNTGIVSSYLNGFRQVMTMILMRLQKFASTERVVHIVGRANTAKVARFKGEDLSALEGVDVELGAAGMRASQMRHQVMTDLLSAGLIQDPETALQMFATGRLEPVFDGPEAREANIERENEALMAGEKVLVLPQDHHADHLRRHGAVLMDPEMRQHPELVASVQAHFYEHALTWGKMSSDPVGMSILAATGQQPSPAAQMFAAMPPPGAAPVPPGGPMPSGMPPNGPTQNPGVSDPTTSPQGPSAGPANMPSMPPEARPIPTDYSA